MTKRFWGVTIVAALLALLLVTESQAIDQEAQYRCGAWFGTPEELSSKGCEPLLGHTWVVSATRCGYSAYVLAEFRDYLANEVQVSMTDAQFITSVEHQGCVQNEEGAWEDVYDPK